MVNIKNWEKFNELNSSTYRRAAMKLKKTHPKRSRAIYDHADEMERKNLLNLDYSKSHNVLQLQEGRDLETLKLNTMITEKNKDLDYWKKNAKEDYMQVPISVLRYISELEEVVKNCSIPAVVGRSEQLAAFLKWYYENDECPDLVTYEAAAERYLSR